MGAGLRLRAPHGVSTAFYALIMRNVTLVTLFFFLVIETIVSGCSIYIRGTSIQSPIIPQASQAIAIGQNGFGGSGAPIVTTAVPMICWGEPDCNTGTANYPGSVNAMGLSGPYSLGAYYDVNDSMKMKFFVTDQNNSRVLIFNTVPTTATQAPDLILGQPGFTTGGTNFNNGGTVSAFGFNNNSHVAVCPNGMMFVTDRQNHRVLGYNQVPTTNSVAADFVIGQTSFSTATSGTLPNQLNTPVTTHCINNMLYITDKMNNRVLVFNPIPTSTNPTASYVIGEPDLFTTTGGCGPALLSQPYEAIYDGTSLYVSDGNNNRILVYTPLPSANGASATIALGQPDLGTNTAAGTGSCQVNQGNANPTITSLNSPEAASIQGNWLAIGDDHNERILFYTLPISTNQAASYVFGQPGFTTNSYSVDPAHIGVKHGLLFAGANMWAPDNSGNRLMFFALPFTP